MAVALYVHPVTLYCNCPIDFLQTLDNTPYEKFKICIAGEYQEYYFNNAKIGPIQLKLIM